MAWGTEEFEMIHRIALALERIADAIEELNDDGAIRVSQVERWQKPDNSWGWTEK
jgi:hypothetical protein